MAKKIKIASEQPTFDYQRVGTEWAEQFQETLTMAAEMQDIIQRPLPKSIADEDDDNYDEDKVQAYFDKRSAAIAAIKAIPKTQKALMAQVLVDVPRAWLLDSAPQEIDWSEVDSLKYVSYDGYNKLLQVWIQGGGARIQAKN